MERGDADRDDRQVQRDRYRELLEELRTILPGVQVLFAFLLTVPFSSRFGELDDLGRDVFAAAILGVALAAVVLLAPAAHHRLAPAQDRADRLHTAIRLVIGGMVLLGASVAAAVFVVVRFVFDDTALGAAFALTVGAVVLVLWFTLPLLQRH